MLDTPRKGGPGGRAASRVLVELNVPAAPLPSMVPRAAAIFHSDAGSRGFLQTIVEHRRRSWGVRPGRTSSEVAQTFDGHASAAALDLRRTSSERDAAVGPLHDRVGWSDRSSG